MNTQDFGKFVAELRKEKGMTQLQLAEKLNVTDKAVSRWETGKNFPDIEIFEDLSKILEVSVSELLEGKRIEKEELITVSEKNVVKQIKKNKKSKKFYSTIIAVILIFTLTVVPLGYYHLLKFDIIHEDPHHTIPCYSPDLVTMMNTIDGYIATIPTAGDNFLVSDGFFFMNSDKTTGNYFTLSGSCDNGRYFQIVTSYDPEDTIENNSLSIIEYKEYTDYYTGITFDEFEKIIAQLDLSLLPESEQYEIQIGSSVSYDNKDLELNDFQKSMKKFILTKDGILKPYTERYLSGTYFCLTIGTFDGTHGKHCGYIYCER